MPEIAPVCLRCDAQHGEIAWLRGHNESLRATCDKLLDTILAMKRDGYSHLPSEQLADGPMPKAELPELVTSAIREMSAGDDRLYGSMYDWAVQQKTKAGDAFDPDELADLIYTGGGDGL